ncbi:MAG TPA: GTP cyclohydrolase I FolE, partial [Dehalococcoidia bacterium]|nr:GTP cyclohydrolase I FolE [Dehalococcoidia bacterium]
MTDKAKIEAAALEMLKAVGEDPQRPGLLYTPRRIADMY